MTINLNDQWATEKLTPMMRQYKEIKSQYKDTLLFFRLGDFYEMFFEDAIEAAKILDIALTAREKGENKTPMCGVPYHAISGYLAKLIKAGKKVAICDQVTEPDGKGIVQREVVRVITPGTTLDENLLEQKQSNYLACALSQKGIYSLSFVDLTTGDFRVTDNLSCAELLSELALVQASELLLPANLENAEKIQHFLRNETKSHIFLLENFGKDSDLIKHFQVGSLKIFELEKKKLACATAASLLRYLQDTQKNELQHLSSLKYYHRTNFLPLDQSLIRNLELFENSHSREKSGSLISVIDETVTSSGGRLIRKWLLYPLINQQEILRRQEGVRLFFSNSSLLGEIREDLKKLSDIERLLGRLSIGTGTARDLLAMGQSLAQIPQILSQIQGCENLGPIIQNLSPLPTLVNLIETAIAQDAGLSLRDGGLIKAGFNQELDDLRNISGAGKNYILGLQEREIQRTGINNLKIKFNKVFGYYIEISKGNLARVPDDYYRKQTLVNAERFITPELKEYEEKILNAEQRIKELEYQLFYQVRFEVIKQILPIQKNAQALAELDVLSALAFLALKRGYVRPEMHDGYELEIINGRHPVIEAQSFSGEFVPNNCIFKGNTTFFLITGPNMGGKSTYLRQTALICLLAQIGSFVPAEKAKLPVLDRIFTRIGAADNLVRGESTFMVEMQETAFILNHATERSLVILDELGRGTSTYDGVSIAWAVTEHLHKEIKCKTLFASHYHELIELVDNLAGAENLSVLVSENADGVRFLYRVSPGGINKSYGLEVAKLAGLPSGIIKKAGLVLQELQEKHLQKVEGEQLNLFYQGRMVDQLSRGDSEGFDCETERGHLNIEAEKRVPPPKVNDSTETLTNY